MKKGTAEISNTFSGFYTLILTCFFVSGFTGLLYEILWTRMIVKIIGSAPFSISIVLTIFMGGLGVGSYIAGKKIDEIKDPLALIKIYGCLELIVGFYALIIPLLLVIFKPLYSIIYNLLFSYFWFYSLITFFGCALILIIPVVCMGATLPVLSRFFITNISTTGSSIGRLYGYNTIGAALGSLTCGFWLINSLGVWGTLIFAIILNTAIGSVCLMVSRKKSNRHRGSDQKALQSPVDVYHGNEDYIEHTKDSVLFSLLVFAISGFCAMAYEVIWVKLLGLIIGPTNYSFTIVLVTFISCLALGSLFFGRIADTSKNILYLLLSTQVVAALSALAMSQIMGNSQIFFMKLIAQYKDDFALLQVLKAAILFVFMFTPTFCLGATFPLVSRICTRSLSQTGRSIGYAYAMNTAGAVLGSFSAGFLLIPFLGKENSIRLVAFLQLFAPLLIGLYCLKKASDRKMRWVALVAVVLVGTISLPFYPHWNRKLLSIGLYQRFSKFEERPIGWVSSLFSGTDVFASKMGSELSYFGDGIGGFTTVIKGEPDFMGTRIYSLYNSGKPDASSDRRDMNTQILLTHFPMLFHKNPKDVLVLGLGSGVTAGEVLHYPVNSLDVVEINQEVAEASNFFIPWNNDVLHNKKTHLIIQDGRAHLTLSDKKYDVIISEPSNPWMAGLAALFTYEFMTLAKDRLNENGIFVQWLHSYQMDWKTFSLVGRTFSRVFPNSLMVTTIPDSMGPDFLFVGFQDTYDLNLETAEKNLEYAKKSVNMNLTDSSILYNLVISENLEKLFQNGPINTDNRPFLEYSAPKLVYNDSKMEISQMIKRRAWLRDTTKKIVAENRTNTEKQVAYISYLLSRGIVFPRMDDIPGLTSAQKERIANSFEQYCETTPILDFSFISDETIRRRCIKTHLKLVEKSSFPDKGAKYIYMGTHCLKNNMNADALRYYTNALKYDPDNALAHADVGYLLFKKNNFTQAIDHFNAALKIQPEFPLAKEGIQKAQSALSEIEASIAAIRKEISDTPDNYLLYYAVAKLYRQKGDLDNAILYNKKALSIAPEFLNAINSLANLYSLKKEYDESIGYFKEMIKLTPKPEIYYNIACIYSKNNRIEESIDWLQAAIQHGYNNWGLIKTDKDLDNIRNTSKYSKIIENKEG